MERRETRQRRHGGGEGATALVVVDMLNPCHHPEAEDLADHVATALPGIEELLRALKMMERNLSAEVTTAAEVGWGNPT